MYIVCQNQRKFLQSYDKEMRIGLFCIEKTNKCCTFVRNTVAVLLPQEYPTMAFLVKTACIFILTVSALLTAHSSLLTAHCSQLTAHSSQLTAHSSLLTPHCSLLTPHSSLLYGLMHPCLRTSPGEFSPSFSIMPAYNLVQAFGTREEYLEDVATDFLQEKVTASPSYSRLHLQKYHITAEVAAVDSAALYCFTFPRGSRYANLVLDLQGEAEARQVDARTWPQDFFTLMGYVTASLAARDTLFFVARFDHPCEEYVQDTLHTQYCQCLFEVEPGTSLQAFVGISYESHDAAVQNLHKGAATLEATHSLPALSRRKQ